LLVTTNFSPINPTETTTSFIVRPKKTPHNFHQTIGDAGWDSEQGREINRETP